MAQNIDSLMIATVESGEVKKKRELKVLPEQYLKAIHQVFSEWGIALTQVSGVMVVTGPGSFTSCRVITTIANTIGFTQSIPVTGIENPLHFSLERLIHTNDFTQIGQSFVKPSYDRPANITRPKMEYGDNVLDELS
ncbi:MAG: hypothetical protein WC654_02540 [Patescibacteria group bacterium]